MTTLPPTRASGRCWRHWVRHIRRWLRATRLLRRAASVSLALVLATTALISAASIGSAKTTSAANTGTWTLIWTAGSGSSNGTLLIITANNVTEQAAVKLNGRATQVNLIHGSATLTLAASSDQQLTPDNGSQVVLINEDSQPTVPLQISSLPAPPPLPACTPPPTSSSSFGPTSPASVLQSPTSTATASTCSAPGTTPHPHLTVPLPRGIVIPAPPPAPALSPFDTPSTFSPSLATTLGLIYTRDISNNLQVLQTASSTVQGTLHTAKGIAIGVKVAACAQGSDVQTCLQDRAAKTLRETLMGDAEDQLTLAKQSQAAAIAARTTAQSQADLSYQQAITEAEQSTQFRTSAQTLTLSLEHTDGVEAKTQVLLQIEDLNTQAADAAQAATLSRGQATQYQTQADLAQADAEQAAAQIKAAGAEIDQIKTEDNLTLEAKYSAGVAHADGQQEVAQGQAESRAQGNGTTVSENDGVVKIGTDSQEAPPSQVSGTLGDATIGGTEDVIQTAAGVPVSVAPDAAGSPALAVNSVVDVSAVGDISGVAAEEKITPPSAAPQEAIAIDGSEELAAATTFSRADGALGVIEHLGKGVAVVGIVLSAAIIVSQIASGNDRAASGTVAGAVVGFVAGEAAWGLATSALLLFTPAAPVVIVFAVGFAVSVAVGWFASDIGNAAGESLFSWLSNLEGNGGDVYAPDIFVSNKTGKPYPLRISVTAGAVYDVIPPWINRTWTVVAEPNSTFATTSSTVPMLHYQVHDVWGWQTTAGWTIDRSNVGSWAAATLPRYGFSASATAQFTATWAPILTGTGAITIYPQTGAVVNRQAPLTILGHAATLRRVWFYITPAMATPPISPTMVDSTAGALDVQEWGVVLANGSDTTGASLP